jgi:hypothetical protein
MTPKHFALLATLAALSACGTGVFNVAIEESRLCKTENGIQMPAAPGGPISYTKAWDYNYGASLSTFSGGGITTRIKILDATVSVASGPADLSFVTNGDFWLSLSSAADGGVASQPVTLLTYKSTGNPGPSLTLTGQEVDVTKYLQNGTVHAGVDLHGPFPTYAWTMNVELCISVQANDNYL